jgi:hypothetical protein
VKVYGENDIRVVFKDGTAIQGKNIESIADSRQPKRLYNG